MDVQIVSTKNIAPASPTPSHLRIFKLSILDQTAPVQYVPLVLFHLNNITTNLDAFISDQSKKLKRSLSETLTRFYLFAGKVQDDFNIDCNDEGVYYVETRVNHRLSNFLSQPPEDKLIRRLLPPNATESSIGNYVVMIQVNIFSCGGTAITTCFSHKIIDGNTYTMFLEDWTATTRGSSNVVYPCFIAPSLFPQIPSPSFINPIRESQIKYSTRRFVLNSANLAALKTKTRVSSSGKESTRFEAVAALLWKCVAKATSEVSGDYSGRPFNLGVVVNLRQKNCLPKYLVGNLVWTAIVECRLNNSDLELRNMVDQIKKSKTLINSDFVEAIKGDAGSSTLKQLIAELMMNYHEEHMSLVVTSMCNTGVYEFDFGWGKPAWFYYCNPGTVKNFISLCDKRSGDGIEALESLTEQDMAIFEHDQELLSFTSLNPAPLSIN